MKFLKNKKVIVMVGITILLVACFVIDYIISNFTSDEIWTGDSDINIITDDVEVEDETNVSNNDNEDNLVDSSSEDTESTEAVNNSADENTEENNNIVGGNSEDNIYIYVTGEVNNQGVVVLNEGSRIHDAINAAGGVTSNANISKMNLVFILEDGMKINIPSYNDLKNNPDFEYITMGSGDGDINSWTATSGNSSNSNSSTNSRSSYSAQVQMVNINTATQTELETLPGIGPSLALRIIHYRTENGKFSSIDEIKNVSGIGDSKFNDIKDYITV